MIGLISCTNRKNSLTRQIVSVYEKELQAIGAEYQILDLQDLPADLIESCLYKDNADKPESFQKIQAEVNAFSKFVFVIPEYNGAFPGVLKAFVDGLKFPDSFRGKKAALVGLSAGTQGAAMAMSHFADILNYLGVHTLAMRPRLIEINKNIFEGEITNEIYSKVLKEQAAAIVAF